jgi:hypothetical protein
VTTTTDLADRVQRARLAAVESMTVLAGVSSACAIARDGGSFPAYKFHEGRVAALSVVARELRRGDPDLPALAQRLSEQWEAEVERRAGQSRDWQAYAAGGLDAVRELESWVAERMNSAPPEA